jgi:hypothetical protein
MFQKFSTKIRISVLAALAMCLGAVPAFAVDTTVADMFALVDLTAVSTGQKALYAILIICTLISVSWAIVTKIAKRAPRAV